MTRRVGTGVGRRLGATWRLQVANVASGPRGYSVRLYGIDTHGRLRVMADAPARGTATVTVTRGL